jgi:hypothetical protein
MFDLYIYPRLLYDIILIRVQFDAQNLEEFFPFSTLCESEQNSGARPVFNEKTINNQSRNNGFKQKRTPIRAY